MLKLLILFYEKYQVANSLFSVGLKLICTITLEEQVAN